MSTPRVEFDDVSLAFRLPRSRASSIKEMAIVGLRHGLRVDTLWALRNVSFTIERGELLGVIGNNGAGKTTLVRLMARILAPTMGRIIVRGSVAPLLGLSAGFGPDLTGRENIIRLGALVGRHPKEMRARADAIGEWAGLHEYLDVPIRTYSSGMTARLGFAIATDRQPDVLLMDEIHAVGDQDFRARSVERIAEIVGRGATGVLISHDMSLIGGRCDRVLWLEGGAIVKHGPAQEVVCEYLAAGPAGVPVPERPAPAAS